MEKTLYLVRHGQTLFNVQEKIQGWCDSPLTQQGIDQAKTAKKYFQARSVEFDQCFTSTSERAIDTLEYITDRPYIRLKGLKEWNFGCLEGESAVVTPPLPFRDFFVAYGGESEETFQKRTAKTCEELLQNKGKTFLAVTHGAFCARFRAYWNESSIPELRLVNSKQTIGNCCIFKYRYSQSTFRLVEIVSHKQQKTFLS
ncbi:histidine phosphatase family protein [Enterococcus sp. BWM-S5]|uniref:Histidine phosphatase family protein n=1 Tax=Enterococcus larvae TaxID=2794352 RepID=A0ABS4CP13_9ENTE|nr:histidine phosphatase family protein [Enterococcus larvae]MBP1047785.1 histidine phosphatase family protein [Enterococcus larvae]